MYNYASATKSFEKRRHVLHASVCLSGTITRSSTGWHFESYSGLIYKLQFEKRSPHLREGKITIRGTYVGSFNIKVFSLTIIETATARFSTATLESILVIRELLTQHRSIKRLAPCKPPPQPSVALHRPHFGHQVSPKA
jgi:hypothetical protein